MSATKSFSWTDSEFFFSFQQTFLFLCMPCDFVVVVFAEHWAFKSNNGITLEIRFSPFPRVYWFFFFLTSLLRFVIFFCCRLFARDQLEV